MPERGAYRCRPEGGETPVVPARRGFTHERHARAPRGAETLSPCARGRWCVRRRQLLENDAVLLPLLLPCAEAAVERLEAAELAAPLRLPQAGFPLYGAPLGLAALAEIDVGECCGWLRCFRRCSTALLARLDRHSPSMSTGEVATCAPRPGLAFDAPSRSAPETCELSRWQ